MGRLLLALLLTFPALAQDPDSEDPAAEEGTEGEDTGPMMSEQDRAALFAPYATKLGSGDRAGAAKVLTDILDDPGKSEVHGQAWGLLAELYEGWSLPMAAVSAWAEAIALDPERHAEKVGQAIATAEVAGDDGPLAEVLAGNVGLQVPDDVRNDLAYTAGRYHLRTGNYGTALGVLMLGNNDAAGFEDVELLRGVVLAQQDRYADALPPLLTARAMGVKSERGDDFDNVAHLNVARAYYSAENFGQAIFHYSQIDRENPYWLDAQFERAWAHFRGDDMSGVVALLMNHESPFFEDWYYPEAHLLRAYALFMMCKFPDASKEMDRFVAKYKPMKAEVDGMVGSLSPAEGFADVAAFRAGEPTKLPAYLLRSFRYEERIGDAIAAVQRADDEKQTAAQIPGRAGALATKFLDAHRQRIVQTEGERVVATVRSAQAELKEMLTGIEITRLDLLSMESKMYERAAATGELDFGDRTAQLRDLKKRKRGFRVWPFQGEYWADELGWFVVDSRPDCPDSLSSGDEG